jgi:SNF2 family DNA or RNA helicase
VFYYDLVTAGTRENRVLKALAEKRELAEELSRPDVLRELLLS